MSRGGFSKTITTATERERERNNFLLPPPPRLEEVESSLSFGGNALVLAFLDRSLSHSRSATLHSPSRWQRANISGIGVARAFRCD